MQVTPVHSLVTCVNRARALYCGWVQSGYTTTAAKTHELAYKDPFISFFPVNTLLASLQSHHSNAALEMCNCDFAHSGLLHVKGAVI